MGEAARPAARDRVPGAETGDQEEHGHRPHHAEPGENGDRGGRAGVLDVEVVVRVEDQRRVEEDEAEQDEGAQGVEFEAAGGVVARSVSALMPPGVRAGQARAQRKGCLRHRPPEAAPCVQPKRPPLRLTARRADGTGC